MRYIRRFTCIIFLITLAAWGTSTFIANINKDEEPPVINADIDKISVSVHDGREALLKGLKATDNKDGDITDNIIIGKQTKFVEKGKTNIDFIVFDSSNNVATYKREVKYVDYISPVISLSEPLIYPVGKNVTVLDRLTVVDSIDGNITDKVKIVSSDIDKQTPGVYNLGVEASNRFGDIVSLKLPVNVVEKGSLDNFIEMDDYMVVVNKGDEFDPLSYIEGLMFTDGTEVNVSSVSVESNVDTSVEGVYQVLYHYNNGNGMTSLTVEVRE